MGDGVDRRVDVRHFWARTAPMPDRLTLWRGESERSYVAADAVDDRDRPSVGDWSVAMAVCGIEVATANEVRRLARLGPESRSSGAVSQGEETNQ